MRECARAYGLGPAAPGACWGLLTQRGVQEAGDHSYRPQA